MAFCRVVFPLLVLSVVSCYASIVPVFMWGNVAQKSYESNPFTTVAKDGFREIYKKQTSDDLLIVVFKEENLSVEDFSSRNENGETNLPYLHANIGRATYLPAVEDPVRVLSELADPNNVDHLKLTENGLSAEIPTESDTRVIFINLKDAKEGESRSELLRRHNDFMEDFFQKMQEKYSQVVGIYTARFPSWTITESSSRVRRAVQNRAHSYQIDGLGLYANNIRLISGNDTRVLSELTSSKSEFNGTVMNTIMTFDNTSLTLNFFQRGGYWFFDTVALTVGTITEDLMANQEVFAIMGFSYRCAQYVSFSSVNETKTYTVSFEDLKIQPFFETSNTTQVFGDSFNCVGFFTAPIWAGLFVVFILLLITFYGIMMMLDIRTMDRFDDPKGKTITINAGE